MLRDTGEPGIFMYREVGAEIEVLSERRHRTSK